MARLIVGLWLIACALWPPAAAGAVGADVETPIAVRVQAQGHKAAGDRVLVEGGVTRSVRALVEFTLPATASEERWVLWLAHDPFDVVRATGPGWAPPPVRFFAPDAARGGLPVGASFVLPRSASGPQALAIEFRGSMHSAPSPQVLTEQSVLRRAGREIAMAYAVYAALVTMLIATLALYSAARDRLFLLYAGYTTAAIAFTAAANGHLYALPGVAALGLLGARGLWLVMLVFNAMALWTLLRIADTRASARALVRRLDVLLLVMVLAAGLMLLPEQALSGHQQGIATLAWAVAMPVGILAMLDAAHRGKPMALATACALAALLIAASAHAAMKRGLLDDGVLTRHGYQFALVLVAVILFVGLSTRIGAVRERLDLEASARLDSEKRLLHARTRSDLGQLLQERLRGLHPEDVARQAFQLLIQHVQAALPGTRAVVLGQGYLGHDLLLVQEEGAPTSLGQAVLAARAVIRSHVQHPNTVQLRLAGSRVSEDPDAPSHAVVSMPVAAPAWAALVLRGPTGRSVDPADLDACQELARVTTIHADEAHASIQLRRTSEHDALTGTINRRSLDQVLAREFSHARHSSAPLTLLFIDIDWFKRVNDEHGHACGDHCLRSLAATLRAELRPDDALGRYGGEEFLVALPGHDAAASRIIAERLRVAVERSSVDWHGRPLPLTISIGLAALRNTDVGVAEVLERADKALYAAKREGRNRVCVAPAVFS
ncbi:MAG: GGDEF domain-containing protein [Pseudomonadota bacterium]